MKEPKGSVLILALAVFIVTESAPVAQEKLPHSQEYYDGYVKALVDHFDDLFRNTRDVSAVDNVEAAKSTDASQNAAKKDDIEKSSVNASSDDKGASSSSKQTSDEGKAAEDRPYMNPEETGKPPATDTEKEEHATPDAHLKNENEQGSASTEGVKEIKQNMFKADEASNLPETMKDIKFYTERSKDFEDMKKRSTDSEASTNDMFLQTKTFVTKPSGMSPVSTAPVAAPQVAQVTAKASAPVVTSAYAPVVSSASAPVATSAFVPVSQPAAAAVAQSPVASSVLSTVTLSPSLANAKRNDMQSESKVVSHSSSTYTPGDPYTTTPQQKPTPPDPNKVEPYKKDEENGKDDDAEEVDDEEDSSSGDESNVEKEGMAQSSKEDKNEDEDKSENKSKAVKEEEDKKEEEVKKEKNDDAETKDDEKEFKDESDEEDTDEESADTPVQPFMGMVLVPIEENERGDSLLSFAGERKDNVGSKRAGDKKKDDKKDDDDDDDREHAYLAPLWGYPGFYEAGHGFPYGYGTGIVPGYRGHSCHHGHNYVAYGGHGLGHHGIGRHGCGYHGLGYYGHGLGHHGYGGYGLGHHGYGIGRYGYGLGRPGYGLGHHGFGHHGGLRLDNGVIWPYGGEVAAYFNTPCGCSG